MSYFRFRVEDLRLHSLSKKERTQVVRFQEFIMQKPDGFCCICMKFLYPEDQKYSSFNDPSSLPCIDWKLTPLCKEISENEKLYMVCNDHVEHTNEENEETYIRFVYPGNFLPRNSRAIITTAF